MTVVPILYPHRASLSVPMEEMRRHPELKDLAESTQVRLALFFVCSFSDMFISMVFGWAMAIALLVEWCVLSFQT